MWHEGKKDYRFKVAGRGGSQITGGGRYGTEWGWRSYLGLLAEQFYQFVVSGLRILLISRGDGG